jgi:hypothetical protein
MVDDDIETPEDEPSDGDPAMPEAVNAAEPRSLKRARARATLRREEIADIVRRAFSTPAGRRERWEILEAGHPNEERFACGPNGFPQPEATWYELGQQVLARRLKRSWQIITPEGVFLMERENDPALAVPQRQPRAGAKGTR